MNDSVKNKSFPTKKVHVPVRWSLSLSLSLFLYLSIYLSANVYPSVSPFYGSFDQQFSCPPYYFFPEVWSLFCRLISSSPIALSVQCPAGFLIFSTMSAAIFSNFFCDEEKLIFPLHPAAPVLSNDSYTVTWPYRNLTCCTYTMTI